MKRTLISLFCIFTLVLGCMPSAGALEGEALRAADSLATLGLVQGTADGDYDLDAPATRAQAAVLLVRLAGAQADAAADPWFAGFRDVPGWAADAVDYAAHQGWVKGVSQTSYNAQANIDAGDWYASLLRMLGYEENADFTLADAASFARRAGSPGATHALAGNFAWDGWPARRRPCPCVPPNAPENRKPIPCSCFGGRAALP